MTTIKWAANQRIEAVHDQTGVRFYIRVSGDKADLAGEIKLASVHADIVNYAARDGLKKRVNDACASAETNEQRRATITRLCDHFNGGAQTWRIEGAVAQSKRIDRQAMYQAIANVRGYEVAHVASKLAQTSDDVLRTYNAIKAIAEEYARLTAKALDIPADEDALFAALDNADPDATLVR